MAALCLELGMNINVNGNEELFGQMTIEYFLDQLMKYADDRSLAMLVGRLTLKALKPV